MCKRVSSGLHIWHHDESRKDVKNTVAISRLDIDEGVVRISSKSPGLHRLFLVGLHPDEAGTVWPSLLSQVEKELRSGTVTLVYCFPGFPLERGVGARKEDPNRCFPPPEKSGIDDPLYSRLRVIQKYVDACDMLVDFHRYHKEDGGMVAFPFDEEGTRFAQSVGIPRIVEGLVWMVEGAVALYAHRTGKKTLVVEAGPNRTTAQTDERVLRVVSHILREEMVNDEEEERVWPSGPGVLRCVRAIAKEELSKKLSDEMACQKHLGAISEEMAQSLDLDLSTRLLLVNIDSDPVAFACVPTEGSTS